VGVIQIRQRSERLGNIGAVHAADTRNGAADALAGMARIAGRGARDWAELGRGLGGLGAAIANIGALADDRRAQEAANAYRLDMSGHLDGSFDTSGVLTKGSMHIAVDDTAAWLSDEDKYHTAALDRHLGKLSSRARAKAERALTGFEIGIRRGWTQRAMQIEDANNAAAAGKSLSLAADAVSMLPADAPYEESACKWAEWDDAVSAAINAAKISGDGKRAEFRRNAALDLAAKTLANRISAASAAAETAPGEDAVKGAFAPLEKSLQEKGYGALFPDGSGGGDLFASALGGASDESFKAAAAKDVRAAMQRAVSALHTREKERIAANHLAAKKEEAALLWKDPAQWPALYETLSEEWKDRDGIQAAQWRQEALRLKDVRAKAAAAAKKEGAQAAYLRFRRSQAALFTDENPPDRASRERALMTEESELFLQGAISPEQHERFIRDLSVYRDKDLNAACRTFLSSCNFPFDADMDGSISASERSAAQKDGRKFNLPGTGENLKTEKFLELFDQFRSALANLPKDVSRRDAAQAVANDFSTIWAQKEFEDNLKSVAERIARYAVENRAAAQKPQAAKE